MLNNMQIYKCCRPGLRGIQTLVTNKNMQMENISQYESPFINIFHVDLYILPFSSHQPEWIEINTCKLMYISQVESVFESKIATHD